MIICSAVILSCNRKTSDKEQVVSDKNGFSWKEELSVLDIPAYDVKGFLNGQEVKFLYINFERWHGSNDNVMNFSLSKPEQPCGYVENFTGFRILNKGGVINEGQWSKPKFNSDPGTRQANYFYLSPDGAVHTTESQWNCVLVIEKISEKTVMGKLALSFNDNSKSWLAGKFEALICDN